MSANVTPVLAAPDPSANPTSVAALVTLLNTLFETVDVQGGPFTPYVISSTTPQVSDEDKIWAKTDNNGRPLGFYIFYNGYWRRFYSGLTSERKIFTGNPATYFDGTGLGWTPLSGNNTEWDGWALCNGNNGTPNLSNLFLVGGQMDNVNITGYSGGNWQTNVTGSALSTGGTASFTIVNNNLPYMPVFVTGQHYSQGAGNAIKHVLVDGDWSAPTNHDPTVMAEFGANPNATPPVTQVPIPTTGPFFAVAFVQFVGYA